MLICCNSSLAKTADVKNAGNLDYVASWHLKSADMIQKNPCIQTALVSTNSITQGDQVAILWKSLFQRNIKIDFAWRTFKWNNEARGKAAVHCVIIGFSSSNLYRQKRIFGDMQMYLPGNINPYLLDAPDILVESRSKPVSNVASMIFGNMPNDDGDLMVSIEERDKILSQYSEAIAFIRPFIGAKEYIQGLDDKYCLWLENVSPTKYAHIPIVREKIARVREHRAKSTRKKTRDDANIPMLFQERRQPNTEYILVPRHSSENRPYIPIGFMPADYICGDTNLLIPDATLYEFGVLISNIHMAWMRVVGGRLKSDYRYSAQIVYNNFVWPQADEKHPAMISKTAQHILDIRQHYTDSSLSVLYDNDLMPPDLRRAHQDNDRAVWEAYGRAWPISDEAACVAHLMKLYQEVMK